MSYLPQNQFGYDGLLPASSIMDLLVIACTAFFLLLTLMREQRGRADRRARPQGRRVGEPAPDARDRLRLDERRRRHRRQRPGLDVQRRRAAAARPPHPRRYPRRPGPRTSGWPPPTAASSTTSRSARPSGSTPTTPSAPRRSRCTVGHDGTARILDLSAQPIGTAEERSTMVLLHDVTAQRARLRELSNFAGMVAHDLRGPLTVLDGWLEVVEDGDPSEDAALVDDAAPQGPRVQPPDAPGDRGLAELHRRPERPAAARGDQAVRRRLRDRGRPPGALGRRRRAAVLPQPRAQRARRPRVCCVSSSTTWSATRSSTPPPTSSPGCRSAPSPTTSRAGSASRSPTTASGSPRARRS